MKVFQIGLGSFGRYGFEKLVELSQSSEKDLELKGVCEKDIELVESAEKFAAANGIEIETFTSVEQLYQEAEKHDDVLIYDSGPSDAHAEHIYRSLRNGFYHLAEKPPSLTREDHLKEKKLAEDRDVFYKVDFIERENSVVKEAKKLLKDQEIDSIKIFRQSSAGIQKMLEPYRPGIKGGDILDKMVHEVYLKDFLEASTAEEELELRDVDLDALMPRSFNSDSFMAVDGSKTGSIDETTATAQTSAYLEAGDVEVELHSGWLGVSDRAGELEKELEIELIESGFQRSGGNIFRDEEARFFIIEGTVNLLGDMLHGKLYDLESGEELDTPNLMHDPLYRVIEKAVDDALNGRDLKQEFETDFVEEIFDIRERALEDVGEEFEELERARRYLRRNLLEDDEKVKA